MGHQAREPGLTGKRLTAAERRELDAVTGDWSDYQYECDDYGGVFVEGGSICVEGDRGRVWESSLAPEDLARHGVSKNHIDYPDHTNGSSSTGYSRVLLHEGGWSLGELLIEQDFDPSRLIVEAHRVVVDNPLEEPLLVTAVRYGEWFGSVSSASADTTYLNYPPEALAYQKCVMEMTDKKARQVFVACISTAELTQVVEGIGPASGDLQTTAVPCGSVGDALAYLERTVAKRERERFRRK